MICRWSVDGLWMICGWSVDDLSELWNSYSSITDYRYAIDALLSICLHHIRAKAWNKICFPCAAHDTPRRRCFSFSAFTPTVGKRHRHTYLSEQGVIFLREPLCGCESKGVVSCVVRPAGGRVCLLVCCLEVVWMRRTLTRLIRVLLI